MNINEVYFLCEQIMASYNTGYDDERFEQTVSQSLHCCICTNVIKDPAMCHNEHIFCRACITRHLMYSQTCPTCIQPLTVQTLRQAPRTVTNLLSELKIRCEFVDRGCGKIVDLGDLERHVADCGFAPAVCSNEGCRLEVNKQDLLHHETAVCELRRVQCHSCNDIRRDMDAVKVNLAAINEKMHRNEKNFERNENKLSQTVEKIEANVKAVEVNVKAVETNLVAKVKLVQEQLNKQEESNRQLKADNVEIKKSLNEITKQLEKITQQTLHEVQAEQLKKGIAEADEMDREPKVVVAGGENPKDLNSVEMFNLATGTWVQLQPMKELREGASSVMHNHQFVVLGGWKKRSIEKLSLNAVHVDHSIPWENVLAQLPERLSGHRSVVYNGWLILIGGFDVDKLEYSDAITEISLVPSFTRKLLATMPQKRSRHGVAMFGDKILIVAGEGNASIKSTLSGVVMYDITRNECQELAPLPYPVSDMATVKWDDDNVMIMGGADGKGRPLNKVLMYNIKTQESHMLPDMKYKRKGCVAAVVRDTVIVMGGQDERRNYLKSVESFRFDRYTWEELAEMHEARAWATAVAC